MQKFGQNWTIWTIRAKLDNMDNSDKIGLYGQNWTILTKFDNMDKIGQYGQYWTIWTL